jgi:hypothetical protein
MRTRVIREIIAIDTRTGERSVFPHAKAAAAALGISVWHIREAAKGLLKKKPKHQYIFHYGELYEGSVSGNKRSVVRINPATGERTIYESIAQAALENCKEPQQIGLVLRGKSKTTAGFRWEYADKKEGDKG